MSDAPAATEGKKKGGKLPMVIILGGMLAAGGYFGMKSKAPAAPVKEPEAELGEVVELTPEFIVNLRERSFFLRTNIALQTDKNAKVHLGGGGGDGHGGKGGPSVEMIAVRDAIQRRLTSISIEDLRKPDFQQRLRRLIAADANAVLALVAHHDEKDGKAHDTKKSKKKKHEDEHEHVDPAHLNFSNVPMDPADWEHEDWDSDSGPVLKVYITSFATQRE
jgi:flagellar basal body-associated protein FliL